MTETIEALRGPALLAATLATGLQAGTYYVWACGVMPGLARSDDRTFVAALQHMNVAIVNPVFLASFLGTPVLAAAAAVTCGSTARPWALAGLVLAIGTVVVTGAANIPLNEALEAAGNVDKIKDLAAVRADFEDSWVRWNAVRVVTSTASLACLAWATVKS
ncbi:anthrone oxygenase family protein [Nocardioides sp.]|uniref:anthrone oxygenase family protein n=1 Tax=Nocardioides sp. TaxID=35761 RepID=UPI0031FED655|nr:integral rane protein [Nocardioides sp.]